VPIPYYADNATVDHLFESINGVLFPGGGTSMPPSAVRMYDNAVAANRAGDHFPLWGTCMGFQWLLLLAGGELDGGYDSENISLPLAYTAAAPGSKLLSGLDPDLYSMLADPDHTSAFNNHSACAERLPCCYPFGLLTFVILLGPPTRSPTSCACAPPHTFPRLQCMA